MTPPHDAWPVVKGRCCNACNREVVIRARLLQLAEWRAEQKEVA